MKLLSIYCTPISLKPCVKCILCLCNSDLKDLSCTLICDIKIFVDIFLYLIERGRFCRAYHSNPILCIYRCKIFAFY